MIEEESHEFLKNIFEKGIFSGKIGLVLLLLILAFINGDGAFIAKNPKFFMWNNIIIATTSAIAAWFIAWNRNSEVFKKVLFVFLFMFLFQVCRELSGYYTFMGDGTLTDEEKKEKTPLLIICGIIIGLGAIFFITMTAIIRQSPPKNLKVGFLAETAIFTALLTAGETYVEYVHGHKNSKSIITDIGKSTIIFIIVSFVFQYGGFYEHVYNEQIKTKML